VIPGALAMCSTSLLAAAFGCSEVADPTVNEESSFLQLSATATSSSVNGTNTAAKAVDGSTTTRWESVQGTAADPSWITVDLGSAQSISEVKLIWENACGKDFTLATSNDNSSWTTIKTVTGNTALTTDYTG